MGSPFDILLVTDRKQAPAGSLLPVIERALAGGVDAVQLREKDLPTDQLYALAVQLRALTRAHRSKLLINDRIDIALAVQADGVHLPADSFAVRDARDLLGASALIGVSTHNVAAAQAADRAGADYVVFGPVYDTPSKRAFGPPAGLAALAAVAAAVRIPVVAIGGITAARAAQVRRHGAAGVALIAAILAATSPKQAAAEIRQKLLDG